ncbi:heavy metal response regulator transcription factor [Geotalea sp. SG265]|uniref:heavy metal response regulator transcription factor n=1 Tax=Geotalea sp. SG265 TaxID=2922867 RepID=UPI001FAFB8A7|nr:heavy metal response regulator transcription factor [Geotalea sp. SG265]
MRILVIEDEPKTAGFIRKGLRESGYTADMAHDGAEGLELALTKEYDIIILDVMLPGLDGWQVISRIRKLKKDTPVIFLTARDAVQDRIKGLELGADDYLVKPFAFSELLVRIRTILRRGPVKTQELITIGDLEIDLMGHRVTRGGKRLDLTPKEFALLSLLARRSGEVLTRMRIAERIWDMDFDSDTNVVDVHMRRLRAKVDDPFEKKLIHTVRGVGYVLEER